MKKIRIPRKLKKNNSFYKSLNYIFPYVPKLLRYYSYMSIEYGIKTYNMTPEQLYDKIGVYSLDDVVWWYWVRCKHGMEELPKRKDVKEYLQYFNDKGVINNKKKSIIMQTTMTFKGNVFSMINFREINGHIDSLAYEGTLCINGKPFVDCYNDGCGGFTDFSIIDKELYQEALDSVEGETKYVKEHNYTLYIDLYYVAETLAYNEYIKNFSQKI